MVTETLKIYLTYNVLYLYIKCHEAYEFSVVLDSNKIVSKHLLSRRQSSPSSSANVSVISNENSKVFEFEQLLETIQLYPISQKDTAGCFNKLRYRILFKLFVRKKKKVWKICTCFFKYY